MCAFRQTCTFSQDCCVLAGPSFDLEGMDVLQPQALQQHTRSPPASTAAMSLCISIAVCADRHCCAGSFLLSQRLRLSFCCRCGWSELPLGSRPEPLQRYYPVEGSRWHDFATHCAATFLCISYVPNGGRQREPLPADAAKHKPRFFPQALAPTRCELRDHTRCDYQ